MRPSPTGRFILALITSIVFALTASTAAADTCTSAKLKAAGKKEAGLLACQAKVAAKGDPTLQADWFAGQVAPRVR